MELVARKFTVAGLGLEKKVDAALGKAALDKLTGPRLRVSHRVRKAQDGAQEAIQRVLDAGIPGIQAGGIMTVSYKGPFGARNFQTVSWDPLSPNYIASSPRSRVFWKKHGKEFPTYRGGKRTSLATLFQLSRFKTPLPKSTDVKSRRTGKGRKGHYYFSWTVNLKSPDNILHDLITEPMMQGLRGGILSDAKEWSGYDPAINNVSMIAWVESTRPFARRLAYDVGVDLKRQIRRALVFGE